MKLIGNNLIKILICIALLGGSYWYFIGYDNMREQKFKAMYECMNTTEYDKGNFDRCAEEVGYD